MAGKLPNSRQILAGTNVTFDTSVDGELTINATGGGGSGIDQLTGDVTAGPGSGSVVATLANTTVSPGTYGDGTHVPVFTVDSKGRITGVSNTSISYPPDFGITQLTGDVTAGPGSGSVAATIANDAVTNAKLANMADSTIKGRAVGAGSGDPTDLSANQTSTILDTATDPFARTSTIPAAGITALTGDVTAGPGSGSVGATIPNDTVTYAKMQNVSSADRLLGRGNGGGSGDVQEISLGTNLSLSGTTLNAAAGSSGPTEQTSTSTGTQNDFNLSAGFTYLKWNGASDITITGFQVNSGAPATGNRVIIDNITSTKKITITNEGVGSTAANRVTWVDSGDSIVGPGSRVVMEYNTTTSRWRPIILNRPEWGQGPWILDPVNNALMARIVPSDTSGTFNDYNPTGLSTCVMMELEPSATTITLTGLTAPNPVSARIIILGNRDSGSGLLTLKHQDTNSAVGNRFRLPNNVDVTLAAGEYAWLCYDPSAGRWRMFVTAQIAGGITTTVINSPSGIKVFKASVKLTDAQIKSLNTTPVQIVAAPGSGKYLQIVGPITVIKDSAAGAYSASPNLSILYGTTAVSAITATTTSLSVADKRWTIIDCNRNAVTASTNTENKALNLSNASNVTGGNAANYMTVVITYIIVDETAVT